MKLIQMLYGKTGMKLLVPDSVKVLEKKDVPALLDPHVAVKNALGDPIGTSSLYELLVARKPETVAITISDITRPVPNREFLPAILDVINLAGIEDSQIVIIVGTGLHRQSTDPERELLVGKDILNRIEVVDHCADKPEALIKISEDPPVSVNRRFLQADFRVVTGFIEPHFMAGFSGGRKGVCPALVDLETVRRFHGYETLSDPASDTGVLVNNPCHAISLKVAKITGVDFLFNVTITKDRKISGIFCGDLEKAHLEGCKQSAKWSSLNIEETFDFVITNGGGYPLDQTFYQSIKGMCAALPGLSKNSRLLIVSDCSEQIGSESYSEMMLGYENNWQNFLEDIGSPGQKVRLDQWQYQMHARVLERIGIENLHFVSDGMPGEIQKKISVSPVLGTGNAQQRAQRKVNQLLKAVKPEKAAVIPEGPYTMLRHTEKWAE